MKRWLLRIVGILAFTGLLWAFYYLRALNPLGALNKHLGADSMPALAIRFKDAKLVGWSGGKRSWTFQAKQIDVNKNRTQAVFSGGIDGEMLKNGRRVARVKAMEVVYNIFSNDLAVPGTAEFILDKGPYVKASNIFWHAQSSSLACMGGVDAVMDLGTVHGSNLTLDLVKKEITLSKVNGIIKVEE